MSLSGKKKKAGSLDLFQLEATAGLLSKYADRILGSEISISQSQLAVLISIDSLTSPVNQSKVAERMQRGLNTTSMMIERLKKMGLITRTRSLSDRRENYLQLTGLGRGKVTKGKKIAK